MITGGVFSVTKRWFQSKTIFVNFVALISIVLANTIGVVLSAEETTGILAIINLILRVFTKSELTA